LDQEGHPHQELPYPLGLDQTDGKGYLEVLLFHNQAGHFKRSAGQHVKNVRFLMYFDVHRPIAKILGQCELEVDHGGRCGSFQQLLDDCDETGPTLPHIADGCPSALSGDFGEEWIALQHQKYLHSEKTFRK